MKQGKQKRRESQVVMQERRRGSAMLRMEMGFNMLRTSFSVHSKMMDLSFDNILN